MKKKPQLSTYYLRTYGCAMNSSDSERIATVLQNMGLKSTKNIQKADVIIFNTCSVRQSAEDRILGLKKNILKLKLQRSTVYGFQLPVTILTGCMCRRAWDKNKTQELKYQKALKRRMPWVDIFIEIKDIAKLPQLIRKHSPLTIQPFSHLKNTFNKHYLAIAPTSKSKFQAYVPISTGCDEFCTYCIVPYARGKQLNRPSEEIINEVKTLVKKGYKDIMLLGQNVNSWKEATHRSPLTTHRKPATFLDLLKAIDQINGDFWLSFLSSHPNYFNTSLSNYFTRSASLGLEQIANSQQLTKNGHIRPYLNLALQSGSNKILKRMNRKYTVEKFLEVSSTLAARRSQLNFSTDIIVGFPGETKKDFQKTVEVMKKLKFDMAYISKYSPRKGTAADKFEDDVPWKEKKRRAKILNDILKKTALGKNKRYIGKRSRVLVEKIKNNIAYGKTFNFKDIKVKGNNLKVGDFVDVVITKVNAWSLEVERS